MSRVILLLWVGMMSIWGTEIGWTQSSHPRWVPHFTASSTLGVAVSRSTTAQQEIPWRPLESTSLTPQRFEAGLSYRFGLHRQGRVDLGVNFFPRSVYENSLLALNYKSPISREDIALGELSVTLPIASSHHLSFGRILCRVETEMSDGQIYHIGMPHHQPFWSWEERYWSWSASPLDRWVSGLSLGGLFWEGHRPQDQGESQEPNPLLGSYRISIFTPQERIEIIEARGIVLSGSSRLTTSSWKVEAQGVVGYHLVLNPQVARWADQQMSVAQSLYKLTPLASRQITYQGAWWRGVGHLRLYQGTQHALWTRGSIEVRQIMLDESSMISPLEEAALAESNVMGDGRTWSLGVYGTRKPHRHLWNYLPHGWGLKYLSRDPHSQFGYDERHRLRGHLSYQFSPSWGRLSIEAWYTHLWSATENRWHVDSDIGGLTVEVGL